MNQNTNKTQDILEIVTFLKDNMVSKDDLEKALTETKSEIMNHVDSFVGLHQKLDTELTALRSKYDRLEGYFHKLAKHVQFDLQ
ncbi:MAG: hypothetical protein COX81_04025 [Candidatus Magasanikbacteria bacterium CG_4_10_14_0_2_um_filter_37_12]|uniref:Uncharacterized protein n=1 Tax=Candidatus Magasanikbacteria bacterium CG_4_10_14_0_2_um_filter_37_12 TaxID=1974637 RepID=A0A2M7V6G3_9BACT|nr:MAG: hypothetical protein COX81_04025 [Candidatus Magasanikbacteria bacterium CG_4_10_14_0_2_um_filter_37_12]